MMRLQSVMDVKEGTTGNATSAAVSALKTMVNVQIHHVIRLVTYKVVTG